MTQHPITVEQLSLKGFRAYLQEQTISLHRGPTPLSLAIFAPNAAGKSSLIDSFEFYFSPDSTLKRLGRRAAQTHAGPVAIEHVDAESNGVDPSVHLWFKQGQKRFDDLRRLTDATPSSAQRFLSHTAVPFIIRGYELRGFVETVTPGDRYKELTSWFGLDPLLTMQRNLRSLRSKVKQQVTSTSDLDERLKDIGRITDGKLATSERGQICEWINATMLSPLDHALRLEDLSRQDSGYTVLLHRRELELEQIGIGQLKRTSNSIDRLLGQVDDVATGQIYDLEIAVQQHQQAIVQEFEERSKASAAVFSHVWEHARKLFRDGVEFDSCPVCDSNLSSSPHGSRTQVGLHLSTKLSELSQYRQAERNLRSAEKEVEQTKDKLKTSVESVIASLNDANYAGDTLAPYLKALSFWEFHNAVPVSEGVTQFLTQTRSTIANRIQTIEATQGEHTYSHALSVIDNFISVDQDIQRIRRKTKALEALSQELDRLSHDISMKIVGYIDELIDQLQSEVATFYQEIQGNHDAPLHVRIELPNQDDTNQQHAQLVIDFSKNRKAVVPSGYLSDSQIHTMALALRLAAIRMLNSDAPLLVLDDIVTSYDSDHRKRIAEALAKHFTKFQIVLVTHDEQFFNLLKDHLPESLWVFKRIAEIRPNFGPVFHDHRTTDQTIEAKLQANQGAAVEIRQAQEGWLVDICRQFGTRVVMRSPDKAFQYERSELADSLASYLNELGMRIPETGGVPNNFLSSLQKGVVENLGSHYPDNPYRQGSVGDETARWEEFKRFRELFKCPCCGKRRFLRPHGLRKPVCKSCETPFAFASTS